jgi:hypothetical protein
MITCHITIRLRFGRRLIGNVSGTGTISAALNMAAFSTVALLPLSSQLALPELPGHQNGREK